MGAAVLPSANGSPLIVLQFARVGKINLRAISYCPSATMWSAAMRLSARHLNTLLSLRTAAMIRGGLKDTCETQETVAAP